VTALRITRDSSSFREELNPLTLANFPALLDGMKALEADDERYRLWAYSPWYSAEFETHEGTYRLTCYLGGLAGLRAPARVNPCRRSTTDKILNVGRRPAAAYATLPLWMNGGTALQRTLLP
jgi:hypothetical protein